MEEKWLNKARCCVALTFDVDDKESAVNTFGKKCTSMHISWFEYTSRAGVWRVLDLLDKKDVKATFNCYSSLLERQPNIGTEIHKRGHEIGGHGIAHEYLYKHSREEERNILKNMKDSIEKIVGEKIIGFRAPYYALSENTLELLDELGFIWDSSLINDDLPYKVRVGDKELRIVELPASLSTDYYIFEEGKKAPKEALNLWKDEFDAVYEEEGFFVLTMHTFVIGRPARTKVLGHLIDHMKKKPGVVFAKCNEIAKWWLEKKEASFKGGYP